MEGDEGVDLAQEHRTYVLEVYPRLATLSHYELLGVARDADKKTIKRAYFHLAAIVHPDRHFGKKLGSFKPKMEALFARLSEAYETLADAERRARYDKTVSATATGPAPHVPAPPQHAPVPAPRAPDEATKKQAALDALKARYLDGKARTKQHVDAAVRAKAAGDFVAAVEAYARALALAPNDPEIAAAHAEVARAVAAKSSESYRRQAMLEERFGHWREAAASWKRVVEAQPDDADARARLASALAKIGG